jgi:hypothetical protein
MKISIRIISGGLTIDEVNRLIKSQLKKSGKGQKNKK